MNKKTPDIRFKGFSDDWEQRKLGSMALFSKGKGYTKSDLRESGKEIILYGRLYTNYETEISDIDTFVESAPGAVKSEKGDVIVPSSGETSEDISRASVVNKDGVILGGDLNIIKTNTKELSPGFLALSLSNGPQKRELIKRAQGKSVVHLHNSDLKSVSIKNPVIEEQELISTLFRKLDDTIALHQRELDLLKQSKKGFLQKMFPNEDQDVPSVRFKGNTKKWTSTNLGSMGETFTGLSGKTKADFGHGEAEYITYKNILNNTIAKTEETENVEIDEKQNEVRFGDALFTTSSETPEDVGMSSVWLYSRKNVYLNSFSFGFRFHSKIDYLFLAFFLRSPLIRKKISTLAQGISRYNISKYKVMELGIKIPLLEEQQNIGEFLNVLDGTIALQEQKIDSLQQMKKSFLQKIFV